jgi:hypothetical protein
MIYPYYLVCRLYNYTNFHLAENLCGVPHVLAFRESCSVAHIPTAVGILEPAPEETSSIEHST